MNKVMAGLEPKGKTGAIRLERKEQKPDDKIQKPPGGHKRHSEIFATFILFRILGWKSE